ncbi:Uncharacterized protein ESCO_002623 [Escovopsis weberi]|uniref:Swiss Army Knife RNA repair protein HAD domain-containing protein n=1 Tax=Escovopsis weberi TaxID=150374 RepID=A0A0M9VSA9_ESCWE|nr:Uncharacterized protein ESCO_002623 [Escovopsis weberi]
MASAYSIIHGAGKQSEFTVTALGRWSILNRQLPAVEKIKALHVYDFDNTLFKTPLPNPALWSGPTIGLLSNQDVFTNGGWWHDNRILAATGQGVDKEEPRAWEGWWNEKIVDLVKLSMKQPDALCVLLTGRSEQGFSDLITRIITSKGLDFDMVGLKPRVSPSNQAFENTIHFKQLFFEALMRTYRDASEIRVYEDRPKHTKGFREFFADYNERLVAAPVRSPITAEVIQVADRFTALEPVAEVAEIQRMINYHNIAVAKLPEAARKSKLAIKKTVFFTSYVIGAEDTKKLMNLANIPPDVPRHHLKFHANNILICPRPCPASILERVGGMGNRLAWEVTGTACYDNSIWAACVRPIPKTAKYHTDNPVPLVVLALRKGAKPVDAGKITRWQNLPHEQTFTFETTVGEKNILRIEPEDPKEDTYQSLFANKAAKRKHNVEDDWQSKNGPPHAPSHPAARHDTRGFHAGRGVPARGAAAAAAERARAAGAGEEEEEEEAAAAAAALVLVVLVATTARSMMSITGINLGLVI